MSPDPTPRFHLSLTGTAPIERRSRQRYEITLDALCETANSGETFIGKTCDFSSGGVRFQADRPLQPGKFIRLRVRWPFLLADALPLQLVIHGRVVRSDEGGTAAVIVSHELRTRGMNSIGTTLPENQRNSRVA